MTLGLRVLRPGLFTTIQDRGRPGFRAFGVPPGGPFDRSSADLANALVGNVSGVEAVLEMTVVGATFEAVGRLALALAGAPMPATIQGARGVDRSILLPASFVLDDGDRLSLGTASRGARTYLATRLGWQTAVEQGSRSSERPLKQGDFVPCQTGWVAGRRLGLSPEIEAGPLRIIDGPDADWLNTAWPDHDHVYRVEPRSNRMGLRLDGPRVEIEANADRVSAPVAAGAVQVAGGRLIVLGVACGTIGGYPHVGHVISADLDRLGQLRPGDEVRWEKVSLVAARRLDREDRDRRAARRLWVITASSTA